ncbi:MAG TPA: alpha-amylase family glycosyl hydrolase [Actinomycetes bacterium]|nr:alpha-amylase family glycosyl hydrolase [Actinomycetes bacterium]
MPDWWRDAVVYQIYPRSFADSNGDGIGDLAGITMRLDHLNDGTPASLGVDAVWLSPFYPSPMADFGYDVSDYTGVDPIFGTLVDLDRLVAEAHARGIRVIIDLVPNHTSDRHPWFLESRSSRDSPKRDWYVWADSKPGGGPPNNWISAFPHAGRAWTFDRATGQWYLHSFLPEQPDLNWWNPEVRQAMDEVMRFWLDRGVDGFRIDVAHRMAKDPELRDNPLVELDDDAVGDAHAARSAPLDIEQRYDEDWPEVHEILRRFRRTLDGYGDRMAVGEVYLLDLRKLARYYGSGRDELHLAHNFVFLHQPWKPEAFRSVVDEYQSLLPAAAWPAYFLSNHDHSRVSSRYDEGGNGPARARVGAMMVLTLRCTPFLYYGEEIGMSDGRVPPERVIDVDGRDPERTPMQWDASPGAGFTTGDPWLPIAPDAERVNVAAERDDPTSMLSLYRRLIWYRRGSAALRRGSYRSLPDAPNALYAYLREAPDEGERLLVALNFGGEPAEWPSRPDLPAGGHLELSTDPGRQPGPVRIGGLAIGPDEGVILRLG